MITRATSRLAALLAGLSLAKFAASVALYLATLPVQLPISWGTGGISVPLYTLLPFLPSSR
jgi:hypothetical protein